MLLNGQTSLSNGIFFNEVRLIFHIKNSQSKGQLKIGKKYLFAAEFKKLLF